jgi:hypothetical protein
MPTAATTTTAIATATTMTATTSPMGITDDDHHHAITHARDGVLHTETVAHLPASFEGCEYRETNATQKGDEQTHEGILLAVFGLSRHTGDKKGVGNLRHPALPLHRH